MVIDKNHRSKDKRLRILFILPALSAGGAERVLITLMNGLNSDLYERIFVTVNEEGALRHLIASDIPFHSLGRGLRPEHSLLLIYRKLRELQPDIVVSTMAHMNFVILLLKPFFRDTRFIVREAITPSYFNQKPFIIRQGVRLAYRMLYPRADLVISPAQKIIDEFHTILNIDVKNHVLLLNPVDTEYVLATKGEVKERIWAVHYVCAGRLTHQKGFDRLIEHLPALKQPCDWHLTILGEGDQREELEEAIEKLGLNDRVTLAGFTESPWPVIAGADVFLMPSRHEGLPNVVLEALTCGTPVIATRSSGGIDEIVARADAGSLTLVDDMDQFIYAMSRIVPRKESGVSPTLLPDCYRKSEVIKHFTRLLKGL